MRKHPHASASQGGYYNSLFAYVLFGGLLLAKILVYICGTPYSPGWTWLTLLDAIEACGWIILIVDQHGSRIGPVLLLPPLLCTLYSAVPTALLSLDLDIFPYQEEVIRRGMFMQSWMATLFWLSWRVAFSQKAGRDILDRTNRWLEQLTITTSGGWLFIAAGCALAGSFFVNFFVSGAAQLVGQATRLEALNASETGKTWLIEIMFSVWLMVLALLLSGRQVRSSMRLIQLPFVAIAIALFLYPYMKLGNRNELSMCLAFACLILCLRGRSLYILAVLAVTIPTFLYVGVTRGRSGDPGADMTTLSFFLKLLGEFVFPHYPLLDHIGSRHDLWYGWSYVRLPAVIFPTFGLWNKQLSLALQFAQEYGGAGGMGFAYTPLGEGFANFGIASIAIVPFYLSAMGRALAARWVKAPLPFLVFVSISQNSARGEFVSVVQQIAIIVITLYLLLGLTRVRVRLSLHGGQRQVSG